MATGDGYLNQACLLACLLACSGDSVLRENKHSTMLCQASGGLQ